MAVIVAAAGGGNWTTGGTWVGGIAPTAADDAQLATTSGNVTIDTGSVCRSVDCTGYTGTLTHNAAATLTIGDATAGLGNVALGFVAGMTYTINNATTSAISFVSTSATQQTVNFAGKTTGNVVFNAASNGSWQYTGTHNTGTTATVTLTDGSLDINGQTCSWGLFSSSNSNTRSLTLGAAAITLTGTGTVWDCGTATNLTVSASSSTITATGAAIAFNGGAGKSYGTLNLTGSGNATIGSTGVVFVNLNRTGTASKTDTLTINGAKTVTGTWTLAGNSAVNRLQVLSNAVGTPVTVTNTGATHTWSNVCFMDIDLVTLFDASAITGGSGDSGGNSDITFTAPATQTWSGTSGGNWSTNAWTSRVPLPQDDVVISSAFSASQTVVADMPRLGRSINWTGSTGTPTWNFGSVANSIFGSVTLIPGMNISGTVSSAFRGRGAYTLTSAGKQYTQGFTVIAPGGTYTLSDSFSTADALAIANGTLNANGFNVTADVVTSSVTTTRGITMGAGTWTVTQTGAGSAWNLATTTGLTFSGASGTVVFGSASSSARTFAGGGLTYGGLTYTVAGSTGTLVVTGANTIGTLNFSDATNARTLTLPASTTTTITSVWNVSGGAGRLITVNSSSAGTQHTLSKASGIVSSDYLSLQDSNATGGATWYAGSHSTNVSNNTGWIFADAPLVLPAVMSSTASMLVPAIAAASAVVATIASATASMLVPVVEAQAGVAAPIMIANASMLVPTITASTGGGAQPGRRPPPWPPWGP